MTRSAKNDRDSLQSRIEEWQRAHPGESWSTAAEYGTGPSAKILGYYEYEESAPLECFACGWSGVADDGDDEYYDDLFDVKCPRCFQMLLIVSHPTIEETKRAAAQGNPKAQRNLEGALKREAFLDRLERECLKSPDELPVLTGDALEFEWDFESDEDAGERWTVIRHGSTEVWREPAVYEAYERFDEVKAILKQRYGKRFRSLTPTKASEMWLYGDHFRSIRFD
jgi:hypothetical protein